MNVLDKYASDIKELPEYKKLVEIYNVINYKYNDIINEFKILQEKYNDVKEYIDYRTDAKEIRDKLIRVKECLYSKDEIKEYFKVERELNTILNNDINELKKSISNKLGQNKIINL